MYNAFFSKGHWSMTSHQVIIKLSCMLCKLSLLNQKDSIMYGTYITKPHRTYVSKHEKI